MCLNIVLPTKSASCKHEILFFTPAPAPNNLCSLYEVFCSRYLKQTNHVLVLLSNCLTSIITFPSFTWACSDVPEYFPLHDRIFTSVRTLNSICTPPSPIPFSFISKDLSGIFHFLFYGCVCRQHIILVGVLENLVGVDSLPPLCGSWGVILKLSGTFTYVITISLHLSLWCACFKYSTVFLCACPLIDI